MTYDEAIKYIHGVSNFFCKPGLERTSELCRGLGNPQDMLKFVHVTGTNGKGSVCSMLSSLLCAAGYKVGLYTSPYVLRFNERMRVNGESISDDDLARLTEKTKAVAERMSDSPTEFELITAIAFDYFAEKKCDIVILEVGMGGKLDATNIIAPPLLSVITGIAIDHTSFLGHSIAEIAEEKAGIIKYKSPVLYGGSNTEAESIIARKANQMQSILYKTDYSKLKIRTSSLCGTSFDYNGYENVFIPLLGAYQPRNAAIVLDAIDILNNRGFTVSTKAVEDGFFMAKWPARFEIISKDPTVIFDGAHNPQGIGAAVESIKLYFGKKKVVILTGVLRDKDYNMISDSISEVAESVFTITPDNPRALGAEEYAKLFTQKGVNATPSDRVEDALNLAICQAKQADTALCCLGSLYTYCEIKPLIDKYSQYS